MNLKTMQKPSKSNVLLTELVIVVLFFALTAATALQLFVGSHLKSSNNAISQNAIVLCQDWVERLQGVEDIEGYLTAEGFTPAGDGQLVLAQPLGTLRAEVGAEPMAAGTLHYCVFSLETDNRSTDGEPSLLGELSVATYVPEREVTG